MSQPFPLRLCFVFGISVLALPAHGADVHWRHSYDEARKEARSTGRPLLVDFGTEACFYCKQLDVTTFRDEDVVRTLNEKFIPVKLDGERHPKLVKALGIDSYPTLVFAASEGKILEMHPGYLDAAGMKQKLAGIAKPAAHAARPSAPANASATPTHTGTLKPVKYDELTAHVRGHRGKVVVVGVWDAAGPDSLAHLASLHERYASAGVVCLSVNVDAVGAGAKVVNLLSGKQAFTHLQLDESPAVWQERWSMKSAPAVYVFSADGKLACRFTQEDGVGLPELDQHVRRLVGTQR